MENENSGDSIKLAYNKWIPVLLFLYSLAIGVALFQILSVKTPGGIGLSFMKKKSRQPVIAIVPIYGLIAVADGGVVGSQSADKITKRLKFLSEKEEVKAVILRINSPGGSVGAVQEIHNEVLRLKRAGKKVIASMGDIAASGGYYVATAADKIMADPGTLTGSIGVIFEVGNFQELFKKIGVKIESIKSAEHKDIASPFRAMTEKERKILQTLINEAYQQFVEAIVLGRNMKKESVLALADGRIFIGTQAKAEGLIDELGNMEDAIRKAAELAELKEKPRILYEEELWEKFISILAQSTKRKFWEAPLSDFGVRFAYLWEYAL